MECALLTIWPIVREPVFNETAFLLGQEPPGEALDLIGWQLF
jgi:hypothetical protein